MSQRTVHTGHSRWQPGEDRIKSGTTILKLVSAPLPPASSARPLIAQGNNETEMNGLARW